MYGLEGGGFRSDIFLKFGFYCGRFGYFWPALGRPQIDFVALCANVVPYLRGPCFFIVCGLCTYFGDTKGKSNNNRARKAWRWTAYLAFSATSSHLLHQEALRCESTDIDVEAGNLVSHTGIGAGGRGALVQALLHGQGFL